ncbi:MAG TPA: heavy metal sensor histidine kinase [Patescibacteria group bacterium]|nr:heavy metal sensor histidine kinase [Patescibacteria group bacterium]
MLTRSIRFKIILWYMLLLAVTLSVFSALLYHAVNKRLCADVDSVLRLRAQGISSSVDTYWEAEKIEAAQDGIRGDVFTKINNANFAKIAQRWVEEESADPNLLSIVVQIFDAQGRHIVSSKDIPNIATISRQAFQHVLEGKMHYDTLRVSSLAGRPVMLRMFTLPVIENRKVAYIVQVATQLTYIESTLQNMRLILFVLLPLVVFITGILGVFLAKIALRPVDRMTQTIHQITAESLKLRIAIPDTRDEIRRLADTFNAMLERLDHAFTSQRQFLEDITHEFKTPLAVLKGQLEVALRRMRSKEEYETVLRSNLEEINRITHIVEDLLMLARFDKNAISLDMKKLDLSSLVRRVADDMELLAAQKHIKFIVSSQDDVIVDGDEEKLRRLLLNIVDNAIKYTPSAGEVEIRVAKTAAEVEVLIRDTGEGIPQEELPYIFDRFYRVDKSRSSSGFGLGLSIAKSIAEAHRGSIRVASAAYQGSTFTVCLPVSRP